MAVANAEKIRYHINVIIDANAAREESALTETNDRIHSKSDKATDAQAEPGDFDRMPCNTLLRVAPLRRSSREIVDGECPSRRAISRTPHC